MTRGNLWCEGMYNENLEDINEGRYQVNFEEDINEGMRWVKSMHGNAGLR